MRILHTSDWHLGASLEAQSREPEHALFLDWLVETLAREAIDLLLVSAVDFVLAQPSAEAQRLYYQFLARVLAQGRSRVVVVGGNHDSGARLDAPAELLGGLDVHVVGGLAGDDRDRCLCPIAGPDGTTALVVLAVPYVHEYRLGVRTALESPVGLMAEFSSKFKAFYTDLCDLARARFGDVPLVATGHLPCLGSTREDAPADIHLVGTIGGLPAEIFDPRIAYVALGHIHRAYHVGASRAWYSGTPVALTLREASNPRILWRVDIEPGTLPTPVALDVPTWRPLLELRGDAPAVAAQLRSLDPDAPLRPFVYANVEVDAYDPTLDEQFAGLLAARGHNTPILLGIQQILRSGGAEAAVDPIPASLRDLGPEEVFFRLCRARGFEPDDALVGTFRELLGAETQEGRP